MATVTPGELLRLWTQESITSDMAVGQLIQHLIHQQATIEALQVRLGTLQAAISSSTTPSPHPAAPLGKQRRAKKG
jgi:hypothetical protein